MASARTTNVFLDWQKEVCRMFIGVAFADGGGGDEVYMLCKKSRRSIYCPLFGEVDAFIVVLMKLILFFPFQLPLFQLPVAQILSEFQ